MTRFALLIVVLLAVSAPVFALGDGVVYSNIGTNMNFESGNLNGWYVRDGGKTPFANWTGSWGGSQLATGQVFGTGQSLYEDSGSSSGTSATFTRTSTVAAAPTVKTGSYSIGWARTGLQGNANDGNTDTVTWVSQYVTVAPGKYSVSGSWDAYAYSSAGTGRASGAVMMVFGQDNRNYESLDWSKWMVDFYGNDDTITTAEPPRTRASAWNDQTNNTWLNKSWIAGTTAEGGSNKFISTTTGLVEIRLCFKDQNSADLGSGYHAAAFDNIALTLTQYEAYAPVPEPSSLLALFAGAAGLCGMVIRRRK